MVRVYLCENGVNVCEFIYKCVFVYVVCVCVCVRVCVYGVMYLV